MSSHLDDLFNKNREWAAKVTAEDPEFFSTLSKQQQPEYLWIGCADSRVPANQIVDLLPGEVFVHRNIANVVVHTDLNCLSVIQFAVDVLKVKHIMVVGHYGCGGIKAAMGSEEHGMIDNWLRHIKDVYRLHRVELDAIEDEHTRFDRMCELNVVEQVANVCQSSIVQNAWKIGQELHVHGWCYSIEDGHITDLKRTVSSAQESLEQMNNM
ncbi:carbonate dehydratase [Marinomonas sp. UCMA 3892]|jgi:carbonic anhydrase|uniref:Carbonic anhydrase n=1 Tax=Marinomonas sp. (strain MWYL1) TaxID=400668 RepID=A6VW51_MARMS|nr:carbonate dehydratase [Marinomonas sp. UCMA 3892]NLU99993.1 carbonate dehydratase [Marinomonas sp. UCMA 3892]